MNDPLLNALQKNDPNTTSIEIDFQRINHKAEPQKYEVEVLKALLKNTAITALRVLHLEQKHTKNLGTVFKKTTRLIAVELAEISDELLKALEEGLLANTTIKRLIISSKDYMKYVTKTSLPIFISLLEKNQLTELSIKTSYSYEFNTAPFIDAVLSSSALTKVTLERSAVEMALNQRIELQALLAAQQSVASIIVQQFWRHRLLFNTFISYLTLQTKLELLNCSGDFHRREQVQVTKLEDADFLRILDALVSPEIAYLDFSCNGLSNAVMPKLLAFLKSRQVVELNLAWNQFTDEAIIQLADFLAKNTRLVKLDLSSNHFKSEGVLALAKALSQNKTMVSIKLNYCPFEETTLTSFLDNISGNGSLVEVEVPYKKESVQTYQSRYNGAPMQRTQQLQPPRKLTAFLTRTNKNKSEAILAVIKGDLFEAKKMIGLGVSPYVCDENKNNLLHLAVKHKHLPLFKYFLLEVRMNSNIRNAAEQKARDVAQAIADEGDKRFIECFSMPVTPAKAAPKQSSLAGFLSGGSKRRLDESPVVDETSDPMQTNQAAASPSAPALLPDENAKKQRNDLDPALVPQLLFAARNGNAARVQELLGENVPTHSSDVIGETALHAATKGGHIDVVVLLLACGASVNCTNRLLETPLHLACDLNNPNNTLPVVNELLSTFGCDVNAIDSYGRTPLFCIAGNFYTTATTRTDDKNKAKIAQRLLECNADPAIKIFDMELGIANMTALHKAVLRNQYKIVKALLNSLRCPINAQNGRGRTALHEAACILSVDIVERLLIEPEIDLTIPDNQHQTALDIIINHLKSNEEHPQALAIRQMIEQRMKKRMLSLLPTMHYVTSLNLFYGRRGKSGTRIDGEGEHARLKQGLKQNNAGNELTASLTFIVRNPDKSRNTITINLQGEVFHATMAWKDRIALGSGSQKRMRSPDALQRIVARVEQAPLQAKEKCVGEYEKTSPMNVSAITTLFRSTTTNPSFEILFHHSEQALLDFLENPETIKVIVQQLIQHASFQSGTKIYPSIILRLHSKHYVCVNCQISLHGEQNTQQSKFLRGLYACLAEQSPQVVVNQPLRMVVCVSAEIPTASVPAKKSEDHADYDVDLRVPNPNTMIERTYEPDQGNMRFVSRAYNPG